MFCMIGNILYIIFASILLLLPVLVFFNINCLALPNILLTHTISGSSRPLTEKCKNTDIFDIAKNIFIFKRKYLKSTGLERFCIHFLQRNGKGMKNSYVRFDKFYIFLQPLIKSILKSN